VIGLLRKVLRDEWTIHSQILKAELSSFIEHPDGEIGAADGCHDDTVIAAAMAAYIKTKAIVAMTGDTSREEGYDQEADVGSFDRILAELESRSARYPFPASMVDPNL